MICKVDDNDSEYRKIGNKKIVLEQNPVEYLSIKMFKNDPRYDRTLSLHVNMQLHIHWFSMASILIASSPVQDRSIPQYTILSSKPVHLAGVICHRAVQ